MSGGSLLLQSLVSFESNGDSEVTFLTFFSFACGFSRFLLFPVAQIFMVSSVTFVLIDLFHCQNLKKTCCRAASVLSHMLKDNLHCKEKVHFLFTIVAKNTEQQIMLL
jgi:hypothetical protein